MSRSTSARPARRATVLTALAAALAVAAVVAGCGGGSSTAAPGGGGATAGPGEPATIGPGGTDPGATGGTGVSLPDACELLSDEDIKEITGWTVASKAPYALFNPWPTDCEWAFEEGFPVIILGVVSPGGKDDLEKAVKFEGGATEIAGVGDRAVRTELIGNLLVLRGDTVLDIQTDFGEDEDEEALAKRVLENLGI